MPNAADSASFRDRNGRVYLQDRRVFRGLSESALHAFRQLQRTRFHDEFLHRGQLVASHELATAENPLPPDVLQGWAGFIEHERIPIISYPYEWTFGMLRDAALLQLDILAAALGEGMILKDASPYNIQFRAGKPVFIDTASFVPWEAGATWVGYRQFCEMYLYPLMLQAYRNVDFQPFLRAGIDGVPVQTANRLFGRADWHKGGVFTHVWLQARLDRAFGNTQQDVRREVKSAGFNREMVLANVRRLRKLIAGLRWEGKGSEWGSYETIHNYSAGDHALKAEFVGACLSAGRPGTVWDIGCNTGRFSQIAAEYAAKVVALDFDHFAVERLYREQRESGDGKILPLVHDIANPSPNWGWRNRERTELAARARPDLVMALAVIHHVVISANVPMAEFIAWLAELSPEIILEFVGREDDKVQTLLRNKDDAYSDYTQASLECSLETHFDILQRRTLDSGNRHLYWCSRRSPG